MTTLLFGWLGDLPVVWRWASLIAVAGAALWLLSRLLRRLPAVVRAVARAARRMLSQRPRRGTGSTLQEATRARRRDHAKGVAAVAGGGFDRLTLRVGIGVAAVITAYSYAISAVGQYAFARTYGMSWWQAPGLPVVTDGITTYGMFRVVARGRRGDPAGEAYGWLLVVVGSLGSIASNIGHALTAPELVDKNQLIAGLIAALFPLAVLAMLEALKGDARVLADERDAHDRRDDGDSSGATAATSVVVGTLSRADLAGDPPAPELSHRNGRHGSAGRRELPPAPAATAATRRGGNGDTRRALDAAWGDGLDPTTGKPWRSRPLATAASRIAGRGVHHSTAARYIEQRRTTPAARTATHDTPPAADADTAAPSGERQGVEA